MDVHLITAGSVTQRSAAELPALLARDDALVWVDIRRCDAEAERVLTDVFGLHPIAVRECVERNRVPKLHAYRDQALVVLHTPQRGQRGHVHFVELDQIVGRNYLITVHGPLNPAVDPEVACRETAAVLARIRAGRLHPTIGFELSHAIVAELARRQEDYIEAVTSDVWRLEQQVTGGPIDNPEEFLTELFRARHGLLAARTIASLSSDIYDRLAGLPGVSPEGRPLVADLADRFERVRKVADGEREYLQGVIEFYQTGLTVKVTLAAQQLTEASYAQNDEMKKISAWAAIFFAPTLIGTVYGMNFEHMPERTWQYGYPVALVLMALTSTALFAFFKRQRWI
jgi:Mg2+ and Co2+ transporter CorA